jgi:hypothetical protein
VVKRLGWLYPFPKDDPISVEGGKGDGEELERLGGERRRWLWHSRRSSAPMARGRAEPSRIAEVPVFAQYSRRLTHVAQGIDLPASLWFGAEVRE